MKRRPTEVEGPANVPCEVPQLDETETREDRFSVRLTAPPFLIFLRQITQKKPFAAPLQIAFVRLYSRRLQTPPRREVAGFQRFGKVHVGARLGFGSAHIRRPVACV